MRVANTIVNVGLAAVLSSAALVAQETKPVPKDSMRVSIPGCTKGYVFTAGPRTVDEPGSTGGIPEGMHIRMNGPKKMMAEIKAHEGSMIEITGLMKKGQPRPDGVGIGGGVRVGPASGNGLGNPIASQALIDLEAWRPIATGYCPSR
jgi:hypothetical protein